ncbi:MAG: glycosyl hydrolase family 8 [Bacteroidales bacterium]
MKKIPAIPCIFIALTLLISCKDEELKLLPDTIRNIPYPAHTIYPGSHIKPNNYSQSELDNQTSSFYTAWKKKYLKNDCRTSEYYIHSGAGAKTISEAHGYGMMIMCFMAGYEIYAKTYFDGLFNYYKSHPSNINNHLMDWQQLSCDDSPGPDDDAASDGDIDIAFSLLLADKQWGSDGDINYLAEAKIIIDAIMQDEINHETWTVKLGDWCDSSNIDYYYGTRSSDFITSHFRAFSLASGNGNWNSVIDACYNLINIMQNTHSPSTGLVPDFIINTNATPVPADENYLEDIYDGDYYYNACRFPWRIGTDYLISGDDRAKQALNKINSWLISSTSGDATGISNGYRLDGTPLYDWNDATFIGPLTVGAMADISNQYWLNSLYEELVTNNDLTDGDYYSNTIKLLSMITISGNYWNPKE